MAEGDWPRALKLAAKFQRLGEHSTAIRRAAEASMRPDFYTELGWDLEAIQRDGIAALKERFSTSWERVQADGAGDDSETGPSNRT